MVSKDSMIDSRYLQPVSDRIKMIYGESHRTIMCRLRSRSKNAKDRAAEIATDIMRLAQGTPIVGYHDTDGQLIIPEEYDDVY